MSRPWHLLPPLALRIYVFVRGCAAEHHRIAGTVCRADRRPPLQVGEPPPGCRKLGRRPKLECVSLIARSRLFGRSCQAANWRWRSVAVLPSPGCVAFCWAVAFRRASIGAPLDGLPTAITIFRSVEKPCRPRISFSATIKAKLPKSFRLAWFFDHTLLSRLPNHAVRRRCPLRIRQLLANPESLDSLLEAAAACRRRLAAARRWSWAPETANGRCTSRTAARRG